MARLSRGVCGIGVELRPFLVGNTDGEIVGIEGGPADHRQYFTGASVHGDEGAFFVGEIGFCDLLQVFVNGELDRLAGNRFDIVERAHDFADAIDDHAAHAVSAFNLFVVLLFESGLADDIAGLVTVRILLHVLDGNFTNVADRVREHIAVRVAAALDHHQIEHRKIGAVRIDERDVRFAGGRLDDDRQELGLELCGIELLVEIFPGNPEPLGNLRKTFFEQLGIVSKQKDAERGIAVHQHAPVAIEHGAARGDDGKGTNAVLFRQIGEMLRLHDLQMPEPDQEQHDESRGQVGKQGQSALRNPLIVNVPR